MAEEGRGGGETRFIVSCDPYRHRLAPCILKGEAKDVYKRQPQRRRGSGAYGPGGVGGEYYWEGAADPRIDGRAFRLNSLIAHHMNDYSRYPLVPLAEVLTQDQSYVTELDSRPYPKLSVKLYGRCLLYTSRCV